MNELRLFISVNIDSREITSEIANFQKMVSFRGIKVVQPDLFHFSLHFLGDTPKEVVPEIENIFNSIEQAPFTITMKGSGVFPSLHNIKVLWIGVSSGATELTSLQKQFKQPLENLNFKTDSRPYTPHLTIGRVKFLNPESKKTIQQAVREYQSVEFGSQEITNIHLMQSTLTPEGPIYQSLYSKDL